MYNKQDAETMMRLWKKIITSEDTHTIYQLYVKYVNKDAVYPVDSCNCPVSTSAYYDTLRDWYSKNAHKFNEDIRPSKGRNKA